jgi:hypothetical protein
MGAAHPRSKPAELARMALSAGGREKLIVALRGIPHAAVRVRPIA